MVWQTPTGGLFTSGMQTYFWNAVFWLMSQAAPLLMIMFAAFMIGLIATVIIKIVKSSSDDEEQFEDWEEDDS